MKSNNNVHQRQTLFDSYIHACHDHGITVCERELPCQLTFVGNNVVRGHAVAENTLFQRISSDMVIFSLKIRYCLSLDIRGHSWIRISRDTMINYTGDFNE